MILHQSLNILDAVGHLLPGGANLIGATGPPFRETESIGKEQTRLGMKPGLLKSVTTGAVLLVTLLLGSGLVLPAAARADDRRDRRWQRDRDDNHDWRDRRRRGNRGRRRDRDWDRNRDWDRDRNRYGGRGDYGYPRGPVYGRYPSYGGLTSIGRRVAQERGYSTGLDRGRSDAERRRSFNPANHGTYRDGDSGHRSEYGSKEAYRLVYREAYRQGYEQGYRQYVGYYRR